MTTRMLIDATQEEEIRVAVVENNKLLEYDFEIASRKQLKGNIYLARVTRVEPSLQAAFVEYGGNRHGFLAFSEIHPDYYRIPVADREALLAAQAEMARAAEEEEEAELAAAEVGTVDHAPEQAAVGDDPDVGVDPDADDMGEQTDILPNKPVVSVAALIENFNDDTLVTESDGMAGEAHAAAPRQDTTDTAPRIDSDEEVVEKKRRDSRDRSRSLLRQYKIQEVIARRQIMLVQVTKEERGNKGAALTTYLSLAGRYCVLMPNSPRGGGVSRKITSHQDRRRMKELIRDLEVPAGMSVILRTAGVERTKAEIKRDLDYLLRQWDMIREMTLKSSAPALIYEEGNLIKRTIRDMYTREIDEVLVAGEEGYKNAKELMRMLMPSHARKVQPYRDPDVPMFFRYQVETQIESFHDPVVQLKSGGYVVINPTEALVSIDVNSGKATRERHIEETALRTNLEAAHEIARQLRLRDLAGLVVIDFIDMEDGKNNAAVERKLKEALKLDRARIQVGRISSFGLLELSRQRLRPSLFETSFEPCVASRGTGYIRTIESSALQVLRHIHEEALRRRSDEIHVYVETAVALYLLNHKRAQITQLELQYELRIIIDRDDNLIRPDVRIERTLGKSPKAIPVANQAAPAPQPTHDVFDDDDDIVDEDEDATASDNTSRDQADRGDRNDRRRRRRRNRRGPDRGGERSGERGNWSEDRPQNLNPADRVLDEAGSDDDDLDGEETGNSESGAPDQRAGFDSEDRPRRRRGRRGGRFRRRRDDDGRNPDRSNDMASDNTHASSVNDHDAPDHDDDYAPVDIIAEPQELAIVDDTPVAATRPRRNRRTKASESVDGATGTDDSAMAEPSTDTADSVPATRPARSRRTPRTTKAATAAADISDMHNDVAFMERPKATVPETGESANQAERPVEIREQPNARAAETVVLVDQTDAENKPRKGGWWQKIIG